WGKSLTSQLLRRRRCTPPTHTNVFPQITQIDTDFFIAKPERRRRSTPPQILVHASGVQRLRRRS
ncbi:MAG: hypothetical protein RR513_10120, partial [Muribaculaceae bacterium]